MSSQTQTSKEKYEALLKEIRLQKSLPVLEKIYEDLKKNKENLYDDSIVPYQFSDDFIWFLIQFDTFFIGWNDPEIGLKRLIYFASFGNFLIKACLIKGLNDIKRKKLYSSLNQNQINKK